MEKMVTSSNLRSMAHAEIAAKMMPLTMPPAGASIVRPILFLISRLAQLQMKGIIPSRSDG